MKTVSSRLTGFGAVVVVASAVAVWAASPSAAQTTRVCDGVEATIVGTSGDDHLIGTDGPDVIAALQGNDTIFGLGGDDIICGGLGDDLILGGEGFDILFGAQGDDVLYSANGQSEDLRQDTRGARMFGGQGDDEIYGSNRWDRIQGGLGDDLIVSFEGRDWIRAGAGHDSIDGGAGIDDIRTSSGRDLIDVTVNDLIRAGIGADTCNLQGAATQLWSCETQRPSTPFSDSDVRAETAAPPAATDITVGESGRVTGVQGTYWLTLASPRFELRPMVADSIVVFSFKGNTISVDPGVGCTLLDGEFSFNDRTQIEVSGLEVATTDCDETEEERSQIAFLLAVLESPMRVNEAHSGIVLRSDGGTVALVNRPTAVIQAAMGDIHGAYLSTDVRHRDGQPRPLIEDSPLSLRFFENRISIFPGVGCNSSGGDFYVSDEDLLILPPSGLVSTLVGCDFTDAEREQRSFVFRFIDSSPKIEIDGDTIILSNDEFVIELTDVDALYEDGPLIGTIWEHNYFETENSISSSIDQEGAFVQFIDETTAVGFDGCREFTLSVTIGPASVIEMPKGSQGLTGELSFVSPPEPHPVCGSGRDGLDVVPTLLAATTYFVDGGFLSISNDDGHGPRFFAAE